MSDFKLTQEDAPRAQATLFEGIGSGRAEAELLRRSAALAGLATVDDLLAWRDGDKVKGICSTCGMVKDVPADAHRTYCEPCRIHSVSRARDIARGDTHGSVAGMKAADYLYDHSEE